MENAASEKYEMAWSAANVVRLWTRAQAMALFACEPSGLRLVLSDRLDQRVLDIMADTWASPPDTLALGTPLHQWGRRSFVVVPCLAESGLRGLLYLHEPSEPRRLHGPRFHALSGMLANALSPAQPSTSLDSTRAAVDQQVLDAENLAAMMERHEWNLSHVARVLGLTRMTIYNRLRRLGVARKRVRKTKRRPAHSAPAD